MLFRECQTHQQLLLISHRSWNEDELTASSKFTQHFTSEWVLTQLNKTTRQQFSVPLIKFFVCFGGRQRETSGLGGMDWMQDTALNVSIQMGQNISLDLDQIIDCYGTRLHFVYIWDILFLIFKIVYIWHWLPIFIGIDSFHEESHDVISEVIYEHF